MKCIKCGGDMIGDGYTSIMHCEYANEADYEFHEPDASPVYCNYIDDEDMQILSKKTTTELMYLKELVEDVLKRRK